MALRQKQLDENTINQALENLPSDDYIANLKQILATKAKNIKTANEYEKRNKLIRFALSRGFEMNLICQCLHTDPDEIL